MKRLACLLLCLSLNTGWVVAQKTEVSGIVISSEDGEPVSGATIVEKVSGMGTVTGSDGTFTLIISGPANTLRISFLGMHSQEVPAQPYLRIVLEPDIQALEEVVITAFGLRKNEKTLGYATTTIKAEELTAARPVSMLEGLAGKVAGMNISGAGWTGSARTVQIRGISSFNKNQPLYILDGIPVSNYEAGYLELDFGNSANDINPEDIESVTVLKGASATALYGSRAANGVVMIKTKNAGKEKLKITYDGAIMASSVLRVMQTQDLFGQGTGGRWARNVNHSWRPRLDGKMREWGSDQLAEPMYKPYSYVKNNLRNFYKTGLETNQTLTLRYGDERAGIITSYGHLHNNGIVPHHADDYTRHTFSLRGYVQTGKLKMEASVNYIRKDIQRIGGLEMQILQHPVDIDLSMMKDYNDERYNTDNYFSHSTSNPYWLASNPHTHYIEDHLLGKVEVGYELLPGLNLTGRVATDLLDQDMNIQTPAYSFTEGSYNSLGGKMPGAGYYSEPFYHLRQLDATILMTAGYKPGDFSVGGLAGWNLNSQSSHSGYSSVNQLDIEGWYSLANTSGEIMSHSQKWSRRMIGVFAQAEIGYKDWIFLNISARNDWSSTLPSHQNSFFLWRNQ